MIKKIFLAIVLLPAISSCKSSSAFDYSQSIIQKEKKITPDIQETEEKVGKYAMANQYDSIGIVGKKMEEKIAAVINEIKEMKTPAVKEITNFKTASIHYFEFIKSLYTAYKNFGNADSDTERERQKEIISEIAAKTRDAISEVQLAQEKFATANGFKLEKK